VQANLRVTLAAEKAAREAIENGAVAPWGDGAILFEPGEDALKRPMTRAEERLFIDAFELYIDRNAPDASDTVTS